ncbi:MAG: response regulator transcription factor [Acidobacteriota bacterium]
MRVLLVDDNADFLAALSSFLSDNPGIEIVGRASSGCEAVEAVDIVRPDLILMDVSMPLMNGLEATAIIKSRPDSPQVLMLTLYDSPQYQEAALSAGADGFILKSEVLNDLLPAIRTIASGGNDYGFSRE